MIKIRQSNNYLGVITKLFCILVFAAFVCFIPAEARNIAGVKLAETVELKDPGRKLMLNGAGIRKKLFIKVYVCGLYLPEKVSDVKAVVGQDVSKRISMDFLYKQVHKDKLVKGWNEGFGANTTKEELAALMQRINDFNGLFETVNKGDRILLDYIPNAGTKVNIKGKDKGTIPGLDFNQALLRIWLGDNPVNNSLKQQLLGLE